MPIYDIFFELEMTLVERFPSLTPFTIRREKATEVFLLIRRLNEYTQRKNKEYENKSKNKTKNGKKVIRRPANDNWF